MYGTAFDIHLVVVSSSHRTSVKLKFTGTVPVALVFGTFDKSKKLHMHVLLH